MTDEKITELKWMPGITYLEPVKYWVETKVITKWFFWTTIEYYICSDFMRLGPFTKAMDVTTTLQVLKQ